MSWDFQGGLNWVQDVTALLNIQGPFSISMWVRQAISKAQLFGGYVSIATTDPDTYVACLWAGTNIQFWDVLNGVPVGVSAGYTPPDGEWFHLMIRHDGDLATPQTSIHADGVFIDLVSSSGATDTGAGILFGSTIQVAQQVCQIDNIKVWKSLVPTTMITAEMHSRAPQWGEEIVGLYDTMETDRFRNYADDGTTNTLAATIDEVTSVPYFQDAAPVNFDGNSDALILPDRSVILEPAVFGAGQTL